LPLSAWHGGNAFLPCPAVIAAVHDARDLVQRVSINPRTCIERFRKNLMLRTNATLDLDRPDPDPGFDD